MQQFHTFLTLPSSCLCECYSEKLFKFGFDLCTSMCKMQKKKCKSFLLQLRSSYANWSLELNWHRVRTNLNQGKLFPEFLFILKIFIFFMVYFYIYLVPLLQHKYVQMFLSCCCASPMLYCNICIFIVSIYSFSNVSSKPLLNIQYVYFVIYSKFICTMSPTNWIPLERSG